MHQQFDKDRLEVLVRAKSSGVQGILLCADTLDTAEENLKFIKETNIRENLSLPELLTTAGTHPHEASQWRNDGKDRLRPSGGSLTRLIEVGSGMSEGYHS